MTDLPAEIAKVRAEYPHWPDELIVRLARCNIAEAERDLETVRRMVADATAEVIAKVPWWVLLMRPEFWPTWFRYWLARWRGSQTET
jgi:hypothetical protein